MNPTEAFGRVREALLHHREDLEAARAAFVWPVLTRVQLGVGLVRRARARK